MILTVHTHTSVNHLCTHKDPDLTGAGYLAIIRMRCRENLVAGTKGERAASPPDPLWAANQICFSQFSARFDTTSTSKSVSGSQLCPLHGDSLCVGVRRLSGDAGELRRQTGHATYTRMTRQGRVTVRGYSLRYPVSGGIPEIPLGIPGDSLGTSRGTPRVS